MCDAHTQIPSLTHESLMSTTKTFKDISPSALYYNKEVTTNKQTQARNVYVSTQQGSTDPAHKLVFQMAVFDTDMLRAPYGVSEPYGGGNQQSDSNRRELGLSIDSDALLDFMGRLDQANKQAAVDNAPEWWKKPLSTAEVEAFYSPLIKPSTNPERYRPTAKTKLILDGPNATSIWSVVQDKPADAHGPAAILEYKPATIQDVTPGCKVMAIVQTSGLWFMGKTSFGMSLVVTHLLVWPRRQNRGIEAFMLPGGGVPKCVSAAAPAAPLDDEDMVY